MNNADEKSKELIKKLSLKSRLDFDEWCFLISNGSESLYPYVFEKSVSLRKKYYGNDLYVRGLIEFTNYCKNDCFYCGIRSSNGLIKRYRLSKDEILSCCETGYELGYRTFVLQGGEDPYFNEQRIAEIVTCIKTKYPDCAVTLSVGEHSRKTYQKWFDAGADRYLLRHETADAAHYKLLHPASMSHENRLRCLYDLKEIGYQVGCGFMVGSPFQSTQSLAADMLFIQELKPDMVGIGPFIPAKNTPFEGQLPGTLELTLYMLALIRLTLPKVLLPATTALGTIHPLGREKGIQVGANVCMPNLSPGSVRKKYALYDNKICTGDEAAECRNCLAARMKAINYNVVTHRGDHIDKRK